MARNKLALFTLAVCLAACGGGGGGGGGNPAPTPAPAPTPTPVPRATVTYIHVFSITAGDGAQPNGPLLQASDGNFYGTTRAGGTRTCRSPNDIPCGVIFKVTPGGQESVLYEFGASASDGYTPSAPLIQGTDGALYGVTTNGGAHGGGTVFRITLGGNYTVLYSFGGSANDGVVPFGGLVQARDGNFYGVTASGGANHCANIPQAGGNCGTIFKITPAGSKTTLYSFGSSPSDGVTPNGPLLQASDGNFYGTTGNGGANACSNSGETHNCGTVFGMTPSGTVTVLHSFGASPSDGIAPQGSLIQARDGALYGTTVSGGTGSCGNSFRCGTVFKITTSGALSVVHSFAVNSRAEGYGPAPFLIQARDGNFYGTTNSGGAIGGDLHGTVFRLTPAGAHTVLYSFGAMNVNPSASESGVIQAADGAFYGVTFYNGQLGAVGARSGSGTVFKLTL